MVEFLLSRPKALHVYVVYLTMYSLLAMAVKVHESSSCFRTWPGEGSWQRRNQRVFKHTSGMFQGYRTIKNGY